MLCPMIHKLGVTRRLSLARLGLHILGLPPPHSLNRSRDSHRRQIQIDPQRLFVGGSSAGAYPAMLAALFAQPRPKGFFSLYGVGGDFLRKEYIPKLRNAEDEREKRVVVNGEEEKKGDGEGKAKQTYIDERRYSLTTSHPIESPGEVLSVDEVIEQHPDLRKFFRPTDEEKVKMRSVADVPFSWAPMMIVSGAGALRTTSSRNSSSLPSNSSHTPKSSSLPATKNEASDLIPGTLIPGHRARISGKLRTALFKTGTFLDFLTGVRGLSDKLATIKSYEDRYEYIKSLEKAKYLFPQLWIDKNFPPSIIVHGDSDLIVNVKESEVMAAALEKEEVELMFLVAEGKGHQFEDRASPEVYVKYIKRVVEFLSKFA